MRDASRALVKFDITDISQPLTVTDIDYFFFFKSKIRMRSPAEIPFLYLMHRSGQWFFLRRIFWRTWLKRSGISEQWYHGAVIGAFDEGLHLIAGQSFYQSLGLCVILLAFSYCDNIAVGRGSDGFRVLDS